MESASVSCKIFCCHISFCLHYTLKVSEDCSPGINAVSMQDSRRTAAGGHEHKAVLARQRGVDGLALVGAEGAVAKVVVVGLRQVRRPGEVVARPAPVCVQPARLCQSTSRALYATILVSAIVLDSISASVAHMPG